MPPGVGWRVLQKKTLPVFLALEQPKLDSPLKKMVLPYPGWHLEHGRLVPKPPLSFRRY